MLDQEWITLLEEGTGKKFLIEVLMEKETNKQKLYDGVKILETLWRSRLIFS